MADYDTIVSRRRFLPSRGSRCSSARRLFGRRFRKRRNGGNGGDGTTDPGEDVPDHADVYFQTADGEHQVSDFQFNPHQWGGYSHISFALYAEWANYIIDQESTTHAVADWEVTDTTMTLHISDEFTWGNGDDITADDFMMQLELGEAMDDSLYDFVDEVEVVDDYTIEITYPEGRTRRSSSTSSSTAISTIRRPTGETFTKPTWTARTSRTTCSVTKSNPSGFVDLTELGEQQATFDVREDSPVADNVNWNGYQVGYRSGNEAFHQSFATGELDGVHSLFAGPGALQQFPDTLEQVQVPGGFGLGMVFNYDHEHFGEREVRQAFAYAIDSETAILSVGADSKMEFPVQGDSRFRRPTSGSTLTSTRATIKTSPEPRNSSRRLDSSETTTTSGNATDPNSRSISSFPPAGATG